MSNTTRNASKASKGYVPRFNGSTAMGGRQTVNNRTGSVVNYTMASQAAPQFNGSTAMGGRNTYNAQTGQVVPYTNASQAYVPKFNYVPRFNGSSAMGGRETANGETGKVVNYTEASQYAPFFPPEGVHSTTEESKEGARERRALENAGSIASGGKLLPENNNVSGGRRRLRKTRQRKSRKSRRKSRRV